MHTNILEVPLGEATSTRYLNYALSVITSRALPDVRDGLKPVQRRILYAMLHDLSLSPDDRFKKSAKVVGEVMGSYHPHGDQAIYDALVRLAQPFSLRYPLVEGSGNFGSIDGDRAAAMRYTEVRLRHLAMELLEELKYETVAMRPTYDGSRLEPTVLPTLVPNLLINGSTGIAVGMATNIPPHNLAEIIAALVKLVDDPELPLEKLLKSIQGPDFPTGGEILNSREEIVDIYRTGSGAIKLRGTYKEEKDGRKNLVIIDSIPYGLEKDALVAKIGELIGKKQVPQFVDLRDESTEDIRIVCELKSGADAEAGMAFLYKHTPLQQFFHVNMTCLVPTEGDTLNPKRLDLKSVLRYFLDFRHEVLIKRHEYELRKLEERLHILEGFEIVFGNLDEVLRLIREANGRQPAAKALMARFKLSDEQAIAIVDLRLYKISKLEVKEIQKELKEKRARRAEVQKILKDEKLRWKMIREELIEVADPFADERRTRIIGPQEETEFRAEDYIVDEDSWVIVTRDGWMKRQKGFTDIAAIRVREGDEVRWIYRARSKLSVILFSSTGSAYTVRVADIPMTPGFGDPVQSQFALSDQERIVSLVSMDPRCLPPPSTTPPAPVAEGEAASPEGPFALVATRGGRIFRFPLGGFVEPSTRKGRQFARLPTSFAGDQVLGVKVLEEGEKVCIVTEKTKVLIFPVDQVPILTGPGQGVTAIKLDAGDAVLAYELFTGARDKIEVLTHRGAVHPITVARYGDGNRAGKGRPVLARDTFVKVVADEVRPVPPPTEDPGGSPGQEG